MPKSWGPWINVSQIAEGGMGHVFKVRHSETGQFGALKRLKNPNRRERFKQEVQAVRLLDHPGIARLIDANLDEEPFYAVYEYEPGGSLADIVPEELLRIPLSQRLVWCEQICSALEAAHRKSLVHRDIKPDNILISEDRKSARLCDFGLVYFDEGERQTEAMEQVGSRFYMAPESEDGRADEVGTALDLYSLGKVLYYVVRGRIYAREKHRQPENDLAKILNDPHLEAISQIIDDVVTDDPKNRISNAVTLRMIIEMARKNIEDRRPVVGVPATYNCVFCGVGQYKEICISGETHNHGYGEGNIGNEQMVYLECNNCGNCQRFKLKYGGPKWFPDAESRLRK
jgi:serine/threonine protein kinase